MSINLKLSEASANLPYSTKASKADVDTLKVHGQIVMPVYAESYLPSEFSTPRTQTVFLRRGRTVIVETSIFAPEPGAAPYVESSYRSRLTVNGVAGLYNKHRPVSHQYQTTTLINSFVASADGEYAITVDLYVRSVSIAANGVRSSIQEPNPIVNPYVTVVIYP